MNSSLIYFQTALVLFLIALNIKQENRISTIETKLNIIVKLLVEKIERIITK